MVNAIRSVRFRGLFNLRWIGRETYRIFRNNTVSCLDSFKSLRYDYLRLNTNKSLHYTLIMKTKICVSISFSIDKISLHKFLRERVILFLYGEE